MKGILKGDKNYDEYISNLQRTLPPHERCHNVFSENTIIYRCQECATGETSCLCAECFESGNHEVRARALNQL